MVTFSRVVPVHLWSQVASVVSGTMLGSGATTV